MKEEFKSVIEEEIKNITNEIKKLNRNIRKEKTQMKKLQLERYKLKSLLSGKPITPKKTKIKEV